MAIALLFAGQGAQKVGMGKSLAESSDGARAIYEQANQILGWDLTNISFDGPEEKLTETGVCQPALFVHGVALHRVLQDQGKLGDVDAALGLSLGELTAYCVAGVYDFATGLKIVAERGRLMQEACEMSDGSMAAIIGESRESVSALCAEFDVQAANFNAPGQIIISGEKSKVATAVEAGKERGMKRVIPLNVAGAYHSRLMEPARERFAAYLADIPFSAPNLKVYTNTTGAALSDPEEIKAALVKQVVSSVLWEDCTRAAVGAGANELWELGPGKVLAGLARRTERDWAVKSFAEMADFDA
ncbi:ACP S-malonyltransferase [bacterium]|nr:ACP S-malonyltransferase [bacterium]